MQSIEVTEAPAFSPLLRQYTLQEFWELPAPEDRFHYDLIGGYLFMVPPPAPPHGTIDSRLTRSLIEHLYKNSLEGEVHHPHEPIYTSTETGATYLEPDMMYVSEEVAKTMGKKRTSADIVFEYASKSTAVYDRTTKADTYLALGVRELWIVDSSTKTIEVRHASTQKDRLVWEVVRYSENQSAESRVLAGWHVSVNELFDGLTEE
ncbi:MAG TPA: Uma2 family endonuclease [Pyrinomonadaceae bacterium]|nr:Uma2 family endonuclease [Pyrinomonadaceae bacterium]